MKITLYIILLIAVCWTNEKIIIACEGNYYENDGSLWIISDNNVFEYNENPIGNILQSLYVQENKLYAIVNGSSNIQVFNIQEEIR